MYFGAFSLSKVKMRATLKRGLRIEKLVQDNKQWRTIILQKLWKKVLFKSYNSRLINPKFENFRL